jgi:hypothetical protein
MDKEISQENGKKPKLVGEVYPVNMEKARAVVIRCSDRRFRVAHERFIKRYLKLEGKDFWPFKPLGGAAALARPTQMAARFAVVMEDIELAVSRSPIEEIILINHEDCRRYDPFRNGVLHPERQDLFAAAKLLARKFRSLKISAYFARFTEESDPQIVFEEVIIITPKVRETQTQEADVASAAV